MFGEGVNRLGLMGSSVIVGRLVGVNVGAGVFVEADPSVPAVVVAGSVFSTNRSGVFVEGKENGVAVN
jgi:hypothetical protein